MCYRIPPTYKSSALLMGLPTKAKTIEYEIIGEGSQICRYCLRRKGHKSQLLAGEGSQISLF